MEENKEEMGFMSSVSENDMAILNMIQRINSVLGHVWASKEKAEKDRTDGVVFDSMPMDEIKSLLSEAQSFADSIN